MKSSETKLNQVSEQVSARHDFEKIEKIKLIAYRLWLARRDNNVEGDAESDYYQAEQILESNKNLKRLLLGSFGFSAVAFVLGRLPGEHCANAMNAVIGLDELANEYELSSELRERLRQSDALQRALGSNPHHAG
jgi:hypothetical protein